jgi:hypothetical protein
MPSRLVPQSGEDNLDALQTAMTQAGVAYATSKPRCCGPDGGTDLPQADTHWNNDER